MKIAIIQPHLPHYRGEFFEILSKKVHLDVFCYEKAEKVESDKFKESSFKNNN